MKEGNPVAGYALLIVLVLLLGLVITTVARDAARKPDKAQVVQVEVRERTGRAEEPAQPPAAAQQQGRVWEGTM